MKKNEQDIIQELKEKTDNIKVPDSMEPDRISQLLEGHKKKTKIGLYRIGALAAACLVLVAGVTVYRSVYMRKHTLPEKPRQAEVKSSKSDRVESAADYEEVYSYIDQYRKDIEAEAQAYDEDIMITESSMDTSDAKGAVNRSSETQKESYSSDGGYSETNVRQEGVDEGDIVKTDGTYLYVLKGNAKEISIVDTRGGKMKEVQKITADTQGIQEMYLDPEQKRLVLICSRYQEDDGEGTKDRVFGPFYAQGSSEAVTYDISDPKKPKELGKVTQSGLYHSSRIADGYLYLFSNYTVAWDSMERKKPETYIPFINDEMISQKDICLPSIAKGDQYTVVTSVDLENPDKAADSKAILSQGGQLYVSNKNIYYYETVWTDYQLYSKDKTTIRRIAYKDGTLETGAQGEIDGYINDSFSIDEYNDYLRIVTTQGDTNAVYVMDMDLKITGRIEDLAEDERVYSARLMGDIGYFVTFRETDPLFSVDFSNPKKPKIIGSLKIPGFSDYLHPYGEGKLLGIGMNVDEEMMTTDGVKLTMFDISDPTDVKEEDTYILENVYSTDVSYDYKAALVDAGRNIIGFAGYTEGGQNYYIFEYNKKNGFINKMDEEINGNGSLSARGVYIGDTLYVVQGNIIEAYSLKDYAKIDDIIL